MKMENTMTQPTNPLPSAVKSAHRSQGLILLLAATVASLCGAPAVLAATAGEITHLSGTLAAQRADGTRKLLGVKSEVQEGDTLTTEAGTYARVKFVDGGEVVLRPGSALKIESYSYNAAKPESDNMVLSMLKGGLRAITGLLGKRSRDKVSFQTATATIGIRGTHFGALLCQNDCGNVPTTSGQPPANGLHLDVTDGAIVVSNGAGSVQINLGQFGFVVDSNTPPAIVPPGQGVQVTVPGSIERGVGASGGSECRI
jgi:hypothetical protein